MAPRVTQVGDAYTPVTTPAGTTSLYTATGPGVLLGFTCAEAAGSTVSFRLHDGQATGATNCLTSLVALSPRQSAADWYGPQGVAVATGVYLEIVNGVLEIVSYGA